MFNFCIILGIFLLSCGKHLDDLRPARIASCNDSDSRANCATLTETRTESCLSRQKQKFFSHLCNQARFKIAKCNVTLTNRENKKIIRLKLQDHSLLCAKCKYKNN